MTAQALADVDLRGRALDPGTAAELCVGLSREDPIAAQQALCDAVSRPAPAGEAAANRLATLMALDGAARQTCERLLDRYVHGDAQLRVFERRPYVSALRLSQAMSEAWNRLLARPGETSAEQAACVVVRLLVFREIEFLLRMFRYKKRNANHWRGLNETYRSAMERSLHRCGVALGSSESASGATTTAEQQYIRFLLLEAMNGGQLSPCDALWTHRWLARWCRSLCLRPGNDAEGRSEPRGFAVDLAGAEGPARTPAAASESLLYLDTEPLCAIIDAELAFRRQPAAAADELARTTRHAEVALLNKLRMLVAPVPVRIERRGVRAPANATVQVVAGLPHIVHTLRRAASESGADRRASGTAGAMLDEPTIEAYGGPTRTRTLAAWDAPEFARGASAEVWQVRDRSDSGCRMRGKTADLNRVIPGSLLAMRANETAPWTVAVVCRVRRLMVDYVEVGVEYLGRRPRFVKVVMDQSSDPSAAPARGVEPKCIGALYLPPSEEHPAMPIRTLLLPAREYRSSAGATLLSSNATYELRLNEPIRRQMEFVWTPFTVTRKTGR